MTLKLEISATCVCKYWPISSPVASGPFFEKRVIGKTTMVNCPSNSFRVSCNAIWETGISDAYRTFTASTVLSISSCSIDCAMEIFRNILNFLIMTIKNKRFRYTVFVANAYLCQYYQKMQSYHKFLDLIVCFLQDVFELIEEYL